jgi:hypothetical protein
MGRLCWRRGGRNSARGGYDAHGVWDLNLFRGDIQLPLLFKIPMRYIILYHGLLDNSTIDEDFCI